MAEIDVRPEVAWFAEQMEKRLRANDHKGGWKHEHLFWLLGKLMEEVGEVADCIVNRHGTKAAIISEAADVGNLALMIADNAREWWPDA